MKQKIFKTLADLRFAMFILLLISGFSIIGTIIQQEQSIEFYKLNYPAINPIFGFLSWDLIIKFGFDHIYTTWWFLAIIFLFGCSLTLCSILQQLPSLKVSRRCQFFRNTNTFTRLKLSTILNTFSINKILTIIIKSQYSIFHQKNMIYCYKGLVGCIAPIMVHFSIILVLLGAIFSSLIGFKGQEILPKTENFHIQNILASGPNTIITQSSARINDFWITYRPTRTISQFYSDVSILDSKGNELNRKTISVNSPLVQKDIYYYQTDWTLIGLRIKNLKYDLVDYPLVNIFGDSRKIWLTWISNSQQKNDGIILISDSLEGYCSMYNKNGKFLGNLELNETNSLEQPLALLEILISTGLQIKTDPGISIIYSGFFLLMISTLASYISYSQIWLIQQNNKVFIGGTTNRAKFEFELEFFKFIK